MKIKALKMMVVGLIATTGFAVNSVFAETYNVRGKTQAQVKAIYGEPLSIKGPVGGFNEKRPPITEWQYDGFFITFEKNIALHGNKKGSLALELNPNK